VKERLGCAAALVGAPTAAVTGAQDAVGAVTGVPQLVQNRRPGAMTERHTEHSDGASVDAGLLSFVPHDVQNDVPSKRETPHFWQTVTSESFLLLDQLALLVPLVYFCPQMGRSGIRVVTVLS